MKYFYYILIIFKSSLLFAYSPIEPSVECTVIKVLAQKNLGQLKSFPQLYTSINNNPIASKLNISGIEFEKSDPISLIKTENFEKISISIENIELILELNGKPLSRKGHLKFQQTKLAEITCH